MSHDETEADTRAERIDPVLAAAGWGVVEGSRIRREMICPGRIMSGGKRGKGLSSDYVLIYKGHKLATLEAKRAGVSHRSGVGQAKDYAEKLGCRFAFASNGIDWRQKDMETGSEADFTPPFPTPDALWDATFGTHNEWRERFGAVPFETDGGKWEPRYYQHRAVTETVEAIARGQDRILLTLATGTGKTSIAFQIAWKLFQAKWSLLREPTRRPRILFLADRNILADQAYNSFSAFPSHALVRITPDEIKKKGAVPKNGSVFFTIFQTFTTGEVEPVYKAYDPDFFDFIVIDECHRGGAKDESEWRQILEYFAPAVQLGLTATPKRVHNADTYDYFGEPVYIYSLKDGIEDGFLTPFKVRQMASTMDDYEWSTDDEVVSGEVEEGKTYTEAEINAKLEIRGRERSRVREFLRETDPKQKTLIFCATQNHAALIRDLINEERVSDNPNYCHRVTAEDGALGDQHLRAFQDNAKTIPTILTTSQKLSTGVDARNVRHIVLLRPIASMIEFKQIIGRGTRTFDGKDYFTVWDFVKAHEKFEDPEWDGPPLPPEGEPRTPREPRRGEDGVAGPEGPDEGGEDTAEPPERVIVKLSDGRERSIVYLHSTSYWSSQGRPISPEEFLSQLFGDLRELVPDEDTLRENWSDPNNRERFLQQLLERGYDTDRLADVKRLVDATDSDLFDVLNYILFTVAPLTRESRAARVAPDEIQDTTDEMRLLLVDVLRGYVGRGESELSLDNLTKFLTARYGGVSEGKAVLGEVSEIRDAFLSLQKRLYESRLST